MDSYPCTNYSDTSGTCSYLAENDTVDVAALESDDLFIDAVAQEESSLSSIGSVAYTVVSYIGYAFLALYVCHMLKFGIDAFVKDLYQSVDVLSLTGKKTTLQELKDSKKLDTLHARDFYKRLVAPLIKEGILRDDVVIYEAPTMRGNSQSKGLNIKMLSPNPVIEMDFQGSLFNPSSAGWTVFHEAGHMVHNDSLMKGIGPLVSSVALLALLQIGIQSTTGYEIGAFQGVIIQLGAFYSIGAKLSRVAECRADDFANQRATKSQLQGAIRKFSSNLPSEKEYYAKGNKLQRAARLFFTTHPLSESRIAKMQRAIQKLEEGEQTEPAEKKPGCFSKIASFFSRPTPDKLSVTT